MNKSESIKELATALSKAQAEMANAKKDTSNTFFKSKYADLASVREASFPALTKHGLSVTQFAVPSEKEEVIIETMLMHSSGEWISGQMAVPVTKADAQGYGSAATYCRRYSLAAAVGIAPEEDDGNAAANAAPPRGSAREVLHDEYQKLDAAGQQSVDSWADEITDRFRRAGVGDAVDYLESLNPSDEYLMAIWLKLKSDVRNPVKEERQRRYKQKKAA